MPITIQRIEAFISLIDRHTAVATNVVRACLERASMEVLLGWSESRGVAVGPFLPISSIVSSQGTGFLNRCAKKPSSIAVLSCHYGRFRSYSANSGTLKVREWILLPPSKLGASQTGSFHPTCRPNLHLPSLHKGAPGNALTHLLMHRRPGYCRCSIPIYMTCRPVCLGVLLRNNEDANVE